MRVLIVNAHVQNAEGQKAFQDLLVCIKEQLKAYNGLLEIKDECVIRTKDNLEDFLYDEYTSFSQANCGKQFDSLDFIIVSGELHILPWNPSNYKVLTLLRMCLKVKKCCFAIGFGMQALVYLSASNLNHTINVINGNGRGGKLGDMAQLGQQKKIGGYDYFLDSVTGDLYHLQQETNEWSPICNIGMHHSRTAQEFNTLGKFVIKTPIYRPKKSIHDSEKATVFDENVERKCYIKKIYLNHWLFHNCDMEFVVPYKGRWEVHSFNFTNKEKAFDILAESEQGALVIEYPRIVGIKFLVSKRYKESCQMFSNFFTKYADQIRCTGKSQMISILSYTNYAKTQARGVKFEIPRQHPGPDMNKGTMRTSTANANASGQKTMQSLKNIGSVNELVMTHSEETEHQVFKHSGMATKMKGKFILDHNYIGTGKVRNEMSSSRSPREKIRFLSKDALSNKYAVIHPKNEDDDDFSFIESHRDIFSKFDGKSILKAANNKQHHRHISKDSDPSSLSRRIQTESDSLLSKADARKWLYPELKEMNGFEQKNWVPGNLSKTRAENMFGSKTIRVTTTYGDYRKKGSVPVLNLGEPQKSLRASDPYVTYHDVAKDHQKKEDGKILGTRTFILSKGNGTPTINSPSPSSRFGLSNSSRLREFY